MKKVIEISQMITIVYEGKYCNEGKYWTACNRCEKFDIYDGPICRLDKTGYLEEEIRGHVLRTEKCLKLTGDL